MENKLVPMSATQFPGSFAPDLRADRRKYPEKHDWRNRLHFYFNDGWDDISIWKSAFVELVGTACLVYMSAMIYITIGSFETKQAAGWVGASNIFLISLFIYAVAPASGGHMNTMITFTTIITGLTGFSRGILYMIGQTMGAALAGGLIRGSFGPHLTKVYNGGGCLLETTTLSESQSFLIEAISGFIILFLAFGVGLDPRQAVVFGPKLGPLLVGCSLALVTFATVGLGPGYPGAQINPSRCFAFAIARGEFKHQWIWWTGPFVGSVVLALVYHAVPPYHRENMLEKAERRLGAPHG